MPIGRGILIAMALVLAGCAGPLYWHEPPQPAADGTLQGEWQGLLRNSSQQHYTSVGLATRVRVRCPWYRDLIRLRITEDGQLHGSLGRTSVVNFSTAVDANGRFAVSLPVQGNTWIWGGVMLWGDDRSPLLVLQGQLDAASGLGKGWLNVSPGEPRLGCSGRFEVARNAPPPPAEIYGSAFEIRYWIDEAERRPHGVLWRRGPY